jgi:hypothetical protein
MAGYGAAWLEREHGLTMCDVAGMLAEAAALLAAWYEVGGDIEDGVSVSLPTREWLTEWREGADDDGEN